jgi:hypothetical protein
MSQQAAEGCLTKPWSNISGLPNLKTMMGMVAIYKKI